MCDLGWKSVGVHELTALPSIDTQRCVERVREADAVLVDAGEAIYLCHWMRKSGLADLLPALHDTVWVGMSAGSMVRTPRIGDHFVEWQSLPVVTRHWGSSTSTIFPHLDYPDWPGNTLDRAPMGDDDPGSCVRDR